MRVGWLYLVLLIVGGSSIPPSASATHCLAYVPPCGLDGIVDVSAGPCWTERPQYEAVTSCELLGTSVRASPEAVAITPRYGIGDFQCRLRDSEGWTGCAMDRFSHWTPWVGVRSDSTAAVCATEPASCEDVSFTYDPWTPYRLLPACYSLPVAQPNAHCYVLGQAEAGFWIGWNMGSALYAPWFIVSHLREGQVPNFDPVWMLPPLHEGTLECHSARYGWATCQAGPVSVSGMAYLASTGCEVASCEDRAFRFRGLAPECMTIAQCLEVCLGQSPACRFS